jgi:hypothetical protein
MARRAGERRQVGAWAGLWDHSVGGNPRPPYGGKGLGRTAVFTIATRDHLHRARVLLESVAVHAPGAARHLILCDRAGAEALAGEPFAVTGFADLGIPDADRMVVRYSPFELCLALKPWGFAHLVARHGYDRIAYFDADIRVYAPLHGMFAALDDAAILLTPHLTSRRDDDLPSEQDLLRAGTYNAGFVALRDGVPARAFIDWWRTRLQNDCVADAARGLNHDQKWLDLVPGLFDGVRIVRDPGWNVAYWNLAQRPLTASGECVEAGGRPLVFYHFSGHVPGAATISRFQPRTLLADQPLAVRALVADYEARLVANGMAACRRDSCGFRTLVDGVSLPGAARRVYRNTLAADASHPRLDTAAGARWLRDGVNSRQVEGRLQPYTRLAAQLWRETPEVRVLFPDIAGPDALRFAAWFARNAAREWELDDVYLRPVRQALGWAEGADGNRAPKLWRRVYLVARSARPLFSRITTGPFRQGVRRWLLRRT